MRILIVSTPWSGVYNYRYKLWLDKLAFQGRVVYTTTDVISPQIIDDYKPDILCFTQGIKFSDLASFMKSIVKNNVAIYYDIDDYPFLVDDSHYLYSVSPFFADTILNLMTYADYVAFSTEYIKNLIEKAILINAKRFGYMGDNVSLPSYKFGVFENRINVELYSPKKTENYPLRVGFQGSTSHLLDVIFMVRALKDLASKFDFELHIWGIDLNFLNYNDYFETLLRKALGVLDVDNLNLEEISNVYLKYIYELWQSLKEAEAAGLKIRCHAWVNLYDYYIKFSYLNFDIGLAPLQDTIFNRCKSALKFYEYSIFGIPTAASNVIPYSLECNYLIDNTYESWFEKLGALISDEKLRKRVAEEAREWVFANRVLNDEYIERRYQSLLQARENVKLRNEDAVKSFL
ncbi:MAG: hypothetical protein QXO33_04765 [Nitrososphaeria archaeon]